MFDTEIEYDVTIRDADTWAAGNPVLLGVLLYEFWHPKWFGCAFNPQFDSIAAAYYCTTSDADRLAFFQRIKPALS